VFAATMKKNKTLIIIDDDEEDVMMLCDVVRELDNNIDFVIANNGEDALEKIQALQSLPDFIFLDLNMPRMNGKQCLKEIRKNDNYSGVPVIIYTTSSSERDKVESAELGISHFIIKPNTYQEIFTVVESILQIPRASK